MCFDNELLLSLLKYNQRFNVKQAACLCSSSLRIKIYSETNRREEEGRVSGSSNLDSCTNSEQSS
jgi:hypothetical protein